MMKIVGEHQKGDLVETDEATGRAYIDAKLAEDAGDAPMELMRGQIQREVSGALSGIGPVIAAGIRDGLAQLTQQQSQGQQRQGANLPALRQSGSPPARGTDTAFRRPSVVVADTIEPGEQETDWRARRNGIFGELMRLVWVAQSSPYVERRQQCHNTLLDHWHCPLVESEGMQRDSWSPEKRDVSELSGGSNMAYLIQPEYYQNLYQLAMEKSTIEPLATSIPMGSKELFWPALDQYRAPAAGQSSIYGGIQLYRKSETVIRQETDPFTSQIQFTAEDLTGLHYVGRDMLADSIISYDALINQVFGMAFSWRIDWECLMGSGVGQFLGIFSPNNKSCLTVTRSGGAGTILFADLVAMQSKLMPQYWNEAIWLGNVSIYPQIAAVKDGAGNALFMSSAMAGMTQTPMTTLQGRPLRWTEKVPALGSPGDLSLIVPSVYAIGRRAGLEVALSEHFLFGNNMIAFRFLMRNDGKPLMKGPYLQADGSATPVSAFVKLV